MSFYRFSRIKCGGGGDGDVMEQENAELNPRIWIAVGTASNTDVCFCVAVCGYSHNRRSESQRGDREEPTRANVCYFCSLLFVFERRRSRWCYCCSPLRIIAAAAVSVAATAGSTSEFCFAVNEWWRFAFYS